MSDLVRAAAARGAQLVCPPELFETPYFCKVEEEAPVRARQAGGGLAPVLAMRALAAELDVAIPCSFFEADGPHHYNSLAMIGPDGAVMGVYRKSHIPDGPGYEEKYYFRPGNTGFKVWDVFRRARRRRCVLGPVVSGGCARDGADGGGGAGLSDGDRVGAL